MTYDDMPGPGPTPDPWTIRFGFISYDGSILVPSTVTGGETGPGTINANNFFINGIALSNIFLSLTGGTITGALNLKGALNISSATTAGNIFTSDGLGGTYWTNSLPGGPYLPLIGGALTGALSISSISNFIINGGNPGQMLSTIAGTGALQWVNPGGANSLPAPGTPGYVLVTQAGGAIWSNTLPGGPYAVAVAGGYLPQSGGTMTGALNLAADPIVALGAATKQYVDNQDNLQVNKSGSTMTGLLVLSADPAVNLGASTKQYVDNKYLNDNLIINGDMSIDQRNNGTKITSTGYTVDRWFFSTQGTSMNSGRQTWSESGFPAPGFMYSLVATVVTSHIPAFSEVFAYSQTIEADMINGLNWGTTNGFTANPITISFWIYPPVTGTYSAAIRNGNNTRSYVATFNISSAPAWTYISLTIPPDTGSIGGWIMHGNGAGLSVAFSLGVGSTYSTSSANTWLAGNFINFTGQVAFSNRPANSVLYITGVKLEIGSVATPFNYQSLSKRMVDCQRYYQTGQQQIVAYGLANQVLGITFLFATQMRSPPTITPTWTAVVNATSQGINVIDSDGYQFIGTPIANGNVNIYATWTANSDF